MARYADAEKVADAINKANIFLEPFDISFDGIYRLEDSEKDRKLYSMDWTQSLLKMKLVRTVNINYLRSLPIGDCNGVVLFLDKNKALETSNIYGQHSPWIDGKSYMQVFVNERFVKLVIHGKEYSESYQRKEEGAIRDGTSHGLIHELFHALSWQNSVPDILHNFITEGQFDGYKEFLLANIKCMQPTQNSDLLFRTAKACLNTDVTPKDLVPDNVACAETVNAIYAKAFGRAIGGAASTYNMYNALLRHPEFDKVDTPLRGDVVISPTGYSRNGGKIVSNGHVGIMGEDGKIMSNDSPSGLLKESYTIGTWTDQYVIKGGYPMVYFRKK